MFEAEDLTSLLGASCAHQIIVIEATACMVGTRCGCGCRPALLYSVAAVAKAGFHGVDPMTASDARFAPAVTHRLLSMTLHGFTH